MQTNLPQRKPTRLKNYDYAQPGMYFITICTQNKAQILSSIVIPSDVGAGFHASPPLILTSIGNEINTSINTIPKLFNGVQIDQYVIMSNHIHMIVELTGGHGNPPLQDIIGRMKSFTTKKYNDLMGANNLLLWQRNYYEHVIRNDKELQEIREYIVDNPLKWQLDKYYVE